MVSGVAGRSGDFVADSCTGHGLGRIPMDYCAYVFARRGGALCRVAGMADYNRTFGRRGARDGVVYSELAASQTIRLSSTDV